MLRISAFTKRHRIDKMMVKKEKKGSLHEKVCFHSSFACACLFSLCLWQRRG
jgi:hypothetical protein